MNRFLPITTLIDFVFSIIEFLLLVRLMLRLLGANPSSPFVVWIYETTHPILTPFAGIFPSPALKSGFILELSTLFALLVYAFIAYILTQFVGYFEAKAIKEEKPSK